jgi:DNA-binding transcriptional MerR regulator
MKQRGGRRFYRPEDVRLILYIKDLLYTRGFTVRGVQVALKQAKPKDLKAAVAALTPAAMLKELGEISALLEPRR